ncbi:MAG: multicopper oxidase domain-containing protein [Caldilineaceae bacterium]|nr:multicopper oxidase domain-containing protein [Caldilineaceae bacterium]
MQPDQSISRRTFLRLSGASFALLTMAGVTACGPADESTQSRGVERIGASIPAATFQPDLELTLTARQDEVAILPGAPTKVWRYAATVEQGDPASVQPVPDSYLGPIIRVQRGQKVRIHFKNELPEASIVHWHGLLVPSDMDGHPDAVVEPGASYTYEFEVRNRAGSYWFHPHPHGRTGPQVYNGLAGLFLVSDEEERGLELPRGEQDIPLVLQDRTFDANNQLVYMAAGMGGMMDQMMGFLGERILVNGQPDTQLPVATRAHRLRLYNGSNSRIYKLAWSNGMPMTVIGTDGGLLAEPVERPYVTLGPAERVEVWADFRSEAVGSALKLQSLAFSGVEAGMMMGGMPQSNMMQNMMGMAAALPNGEPFDVLTVQVAREEAESLTLPTQLPPIEHHAVADAVNGDQPRHFTFAMDNNMAWTINGRTFVMDEVAEDETVHFGDLELWHFYNGMTATGSDTSAGGMMGGMMGHGGHMGHGNQSDQNNQSGMMGGGMMDFMAHPVHLHGVQFQVVARTIDDDQRAGWETVKEGYVDVGWKDTVLMMPGEMVQVLMRFDAYAGRYLYHCHNLEHEDQGMMRNFEIV